MRGKSVVYARPRMCCTIVEARLKHALVQRLSVGKEQHPDEIKMQGTWAHCLFNLTRHIRRDFVDFMVNLDIQHGLAIKIMMAISALTCQSAAFAPGMFLQVSALAVRRTAGL